MAKPRPVSSLDLYGSESTRIKGPVRSRILSFGTPSPAPRISNFKISLVANAVNVTLPSFKVNVVAFDKRFKTIGLRAQ